MRPFTLLMFFFLTVKGYAQIPLHDVQDSIVVNGKISNYRPNSNNHFVTFGTYDVQGRLIRQAIQVADNGSFSIQLYQPFEGDIELNYKDHYLNLYARPNEPIMVEIDDERDDFTVTGKLAPTNNLMLQFHKAMEKHQFLLKSDMGNKTQTDSIYALSVRKQLEEKLQFLNSFVKEHQVKNNEFITWQRNHLQYAAAQEILFFPSAGKFNKTITSAQLLGLIKGIPIENRSGLRNSSYYKFLSSLTGDHQIMVNINPIYDDQKQKAGKNVLGVYFNEVDKFSGPIARELIYYNLCISRGSNSSNPRDFTNRINGTITTLLLRKMLTEKSTPGNTDFKPYAISDRLKASKVSNTLKAKLLDLFEGYKGTNLYIDFWGDWCGPCMSEMPDYPRLIKALEGKPIKFLFLSTFTTQENMLAVKEKYQINGDFVNLNKDEVAIVNNIFGFHSYPSHFLVNNKGMVVDRLSKMATAGATQKASEIIEILKKNN